MPASNRHGRARMTMTGPVFGQYQLPDVCRNCPDQPCVNACHLDGMHLHDGKTFVSDACRGCNKCVEACPYGVIALLPREHQKREGFFKRVIGQARGLGNGHKAILDGHVAADPSRCVQCGICGYNCPVASSASTSSRTTRRSSTATATHAVVEAVRAQAGRMASGAGPSELEVELAERLKERLPSIELLRFTNSGTEATMLALRAARAFTGRSVIATFAGAYHGTHDLAVSIPADAAARPGGRGVPAEVAESIVVAPYNDVEATAALLEPHLDDLAAVIVEPVLGAGGVIPADPALPLVPPRADPQGRSAPGVRRGDRVPDRLPRRAGALRGHARPDDAREDHRRRPPDRGVRRPGGRDGALRPALAGPHAARRHLQREPALDCRGSRDARRASAGRVRAARIARRPACGRASRHSSHARSVPACVTQIGSLFNVHFTRGPIHTHADVLAGDLGLLRELHLALLGHGILSTPRGMGCLSTPMGEAEIDAFVEAAELSLRELGRGPLTPGG